MQVGGTSACGPLWAGLIALINQGVGRNVGYINPLLYSKLGPEGIFPTSPKGRMASTASKGLRPALGGMQYGLGQPERPETSRGDPIALIRKSGRVLSNKSWAERCCT